MASIYGTDEERRMALQKYMLMKRKVPSNRVVEAVKNALMKNKKKGKMSMMVQAPYGWGVPSDELMGVGQDDQQQEYVPEDTEYYPGNQEAPETVIDMDQQAAAQVTEDMDYTDQSADAGEQMANQDYEQYEYQDDQQRYDESQQYDQETDIIDQSQPEIYDASNYPGQVAPMDMPQDYPPDFTPEVPGFPNPSVISPMTPPATPPPQPINAPIISILPPAAPSVQPPTMKSTADTNAAAAALKAARAKAAQAAAEQNASQAARVSQAVKDAQAAKAAQAAQAAKAAQAAAAAQSAAAARANQARVNAAQADQAAKVAQAIKAARDAQAAAQAVQASKDAQAVQAAKVAQAEQAAAKLQAAHVAQQKALDEVKAKAAAMSQKSSTQPLTYDDLMKTKKAADAYTAATAATNKAVAQATTITIPKSIPTDKWVKNPNGIEWDMHHDSVSKKYQVRVKDSMFPINNPNTGQNFIVTHLIPDAKDAYVVATNLTTTQLAQARMKAVKGGTPVLMTGYGRLRNSFNQQRGSNTYPFNQQRGSNIFNKKKGYNGEIVNGVLKIPGGFWTPKKKLNKLVNLLHSKIKPPARPIQNHGNIPNYELEDRRMGEVGHHHHGGRRRGGGGWGPDYYPYYPDYWLYDQPDVVYVEQTDSALTGDVGKGHPGGGRRMSRLDPYYDPYYYPQDVIYTDALEGVPLPGQVQGDASEFFESQEEEQRQLLKATGVDAPFTEEEEQRQLLQATGVRWQEEYGATVAPPTYTDYRPTDALSHEPAQVADPMQDSQWYKVDEAAEWMEQEQGRRAEYERWVESELAKRGMTREDLYKPPEERKENKDDEQWWKPVGT